MKHYKLNYNGVDIVKENGELIKVYFNQNSGKAYFRYKIDSLTNIKHPGIFLGSDRLGTEYFLHNHYHIGRASVVTGEEFKQGMPIDVYKMNCSNPPLKVLEIAMQQVLDRKPYHFLNYNCQNYTNTACDNDNSSEDVVRIGKGLLVSALVVLGVKLLFNDKAA